MQKSEAMSVLPTQKISVPVLEGLACFHFTQSFIAKQVGVRQTLVSEWHTGIRGLEASEARLLTALLETAVTAAEKEGDDPCLSSMAKLMLYKRAQVARAWLELQKEMNEVELPADSKDHALAVYERLIEQRQKPQQRRTAER